MTGWALFDDFTDSVLGHHPDFIIGLANAAAATVTDSSSAVRLYCPESYLAHHAPSVSVVHRNTTGGSPGSGDAKLHYSRVVDHVNLANATRDAAANGVTVFFNCYFDENYPAWPAPEPGLRYVHSLHRPGYFAADAGQRADGRLLADFVRERAQSGLFVVNTRAGERQARRFVAPRDLLRTGWPTATRSEVAARFERPWAEASTEPYVLSVGSARSDKGIDMLMSALTGGAKLRIVGQQYDGVEAQLTTKYPDTRVDWETGWISRRRLFEAIDEAAVLVFPYQPEFAGYGGASGALAQALTTGKPVIVSEVLADQIPTSDACRVVPSTDERALRLAIEEALRDTRSLHEAALETRAYVEQNHTYEGHLQQILDRCS